VSCAAKSCSRVETRAYPYRGMGLPLPDGQFFA
jgi:hypothetical protein